MAGQPHSTAFTGHEQNLSQQESIALHLLQSLPQGVAAVNRESELLCINKTLLDLVGLHDLEISLPIKINCYDLPEPLRILLSPCAQNIIGPYEMKTSELEWPTPERILRVEPLEMYADSVCVMVLVTDVTPERIAESARAEFMSQIAHELRTPLQHIMGFAGIMNDIEDLEPGDYQHFSAQINSETKIMARLISDLAELSLITGGRFIIEREPIDLASLVREMTSRTQPSARDHDLELDCVVPPKAVPIYGDAVRLSQVLANLLENAIKYVPAGGQVHVTLQIIEGHAVVSVADTGKGIPADAVEHVFDQFFQVPQSGGNRSHRGMGLGLYISREIIHAHDGRIWVESEQGKGSTFAFSLSLMPESEAKS